MPAPAEYRPSLIDPGRFPHLFDAESGLLKMDPVTVTDLLATSQNLRGRPEYEISIVDNKIHFSNGGTKYSLEAVQVLDAAEHKIGISYPIVWGATVEGDTHAGDIIEPHIIVPPNTDNLAFRLKWNSEEPHDIQVFGAIDETTGKEPVAGLVNQLRGQLGRASKGEMLIFRYQGDSSTASGFNVQPATIPDQQGRTVLLPPNSFENLSSGGFDLVVIPGKITTTAPPVIIFPPAGDNSFGNLKDIFGSSEDKSLSFGAMREIHLPSSYAASVGTGRSFGSSGTAAFESEKSKAIAVKFRIRINADIPPLEGTTGYVAWLNSQREAGKVYRSVICTYCNHQALQEQAEIVDGTLHVHGNCLCGARNFAVVEYLTTRAH